MNVNCPGCPTRGAALSNPDGHSANQACRRWAINLAAAGHLIVVPEIADYEVRRELSRLGKTKSLARLDALKDDFRYAPLTHHRHAPGRRYLG